MAQLGNTVINGSLYVSGGVSGSIDTAVGDKNGNDIFTNYGASLTLTGGSSASYVVRLISKSGASLATITLPPRTLDAVLSSGATSSRAVTLSGTLTLSGAVNSSGTLTQSGVLIVSNATEYSSASVAAVRISGGVYVAKKIYCASTIQATSVKGAVWNDIAEFREVEPSDLEPGTVVYEKGDDKMVRTQARLCLGCGIISDTYGFSMGETEEARCPIAIAGRVLAKYSGEKKDYSIGQAVCSGPEGRVSPMTRKEIQEYPDAIIGYVSTFPTYSHWGSGNVETKGRVWIRLA